jgi:hypothetical protein
MQFGRPAAHNSRISLESPEPDTEPARPLCLFLKDFNGSALAAEVCATDNKRPYYNSDVAHLPPTDEKSQRMAFFKFEVVIR